MFTLTSTIIFLIGAFGTIENKNTKTEKSNFHHLEPSVIKVACDLNTKASYVKIPTEHIKITKNSN
tara:strand:+ start:354 stop:551 length:198 start_codon:yes stop_codon:yes gene_type:complete